MSEQFSLMPRPYFQKTCGVSGCFDQASAVAILAAMQRVVTQGGQIEQSELATQMLSATRDHVFQRAVDLTDLPDIQPDALAAQLREPCQRLLALQLLILMPYLPMAVAPAAVAQVDAFAKALNLKPATLVDLHRVRDRQMGRLLWGYTQRAVQFFAPQAKLLGGFRLVYKAGRQYFGDAQVARRYQALATYPEGSMGRVLYDYFRDRNFPLPGERHSFSEVLVPHDLLHLLSGIGTDAAGEITIAGFEAGLCSDPDIGFELLLEVILDFHLGLKFTTFNILEPSLGQLQPEALMAAFRRGTEVKQDLLHPSWDYWRDMATPIEQVRCHYGIRPMTAAQITAIPVASTS